MLEIASQIAICLLIAAIIGFIIGFIVAKSVYNTPKTMENEDITESKETNKIESEQPDAKEVATQKETDTKKKAAEKAAKEKKKAEAASKEKAEAQKAADAKAKADAEAQAKAEKLAKEGEKPELLKSPRKGEKDDLTQIKGIGPKVAEQLNEAGIFHFEQIAAWTDANITWLEINTTFAHRATKDLWVNQAKSFI